MNNTNVIYPLKKASEGLLFMSESEYPFEVFLWDSSDTQITPEKIIQKTNHPVDTPVEVVGLDEFFAVATTEEDWHEAEEKETVKKYQNLVETIKKCLKNVTVYRLGKRRIDIYIVGKTESDSVAGLATKVVET